MMRGEPGAISSASVAKPLEQRPPAGEPSALARRMAKPSAGQVQLGQRRADARAQ